MQVFARNACHIYYGLIFDTMPVCAFSPETMLFLGFSAFQSVERERVCGTVLICCCGFCSQKRPLNLQSLKSMASLKGLIDAVGVSEMVSDLLMRRLIIKHVGYKRDCRHSLLPVAVINIRHIFLPCNSDKYFLVGIEFLLGFLGFPRRICNRS